MALKNYIMDYKNTAIIGDKKIKFKPWNTKNEKDYLIAMDGEDEINDEKLFEILIKPCLENPDIVLSVDEQKILMIEIRKKSIGTSFNMRYVCNKCKQVNDITVEFDQVVNFKPDEFRPVEIENLVFEFGDIASNKLKERLNNTENKIEYAFIDFLIHIKSIEIDGQLEDTFTFDELKEYIEQLPASIFDYVYNEYSKMKSNLNFKLKTFCMSCNAETELQLDKIPNFLWT